MNTKEAPLVSVITPVYNGAEYIAECVESVLAQTYKNFEYIVVDNCSKDATVEIVRRYAFWWFTCRDRNKPSGRDWARQLGISHTWLQKLVRQFEADPNEMWRMQMAYGDPTFAEFSQAKEVSKEMKRRGQLRPSYQTKYRFF